MDNKIQAFVSEQLKTEIPQFNIGDTVEVQNKIKEGSRERNCTVCEYVQTETIPMLEHEHSYGGWQSDETEHWKECRCGEKT